MTKEPMEECSSELDPCRTFQNGEVKYTYKLENVYLPEKRREEKQWRLTAFSWPDVRRNPLEARNMADDFDGDGLVGAKQTREFYEDRAGR